MNLNTAKKTEALSDRCDDDWDETALKAACFALAWLGSCLIISQLGHWTTAHSNCCVLVVQNRSKSLRAICKVRSTQLTPVSAHSAPRWTLYLESLSTTDDLIMSEMAPKKTLRDVKRQIRAKCRQGRFRNFKGRNLWVALGQILTTFFQETTHAAVTAGATRTREGTGKSFRCQMPFPSFFLAPQREQPAIAFR